MLLSSTHWTPSDSCYADLRPTVKVTNIVIIISLKDIVTTHHQIHDNTIYNILVKAYFDIKSINITNQQN